LFNVSIPANSLICKESEILSEAILTQQIFNLYYSLEGPFEQSSAFGISQLEHVLKKHLIIENHWEAKIVLKLLWLFILTEGAIGFLGEGRRRGTKTRAFPLLGEDLYKKMNPTFLLKLWNSIIFI